MNTNQILPLDIPQAKKPFSPNRMRLFYSGSALVLLALMFLGFQQFYLHGRAYPDRELAPPIRNLVILHGLSMTGWVLLFLVQPMLILAGKRQVHKTIGRIGAALAAAIVITGFQLGIASTQIKPSEMKLWELDPIQFLVVPIISILTFAVFVIAGLWNRRRPEVHRPMMLLATLAAIPAAIDRIDFITFFYHGTVLGTLFGPLFGGIVIGLFLLVPQCLVTKSLDRWLALGYLGLVLSGALAMQLAKTGAWELFAGFLLR